MELELDGSSSAGLVGIIYTHDPGLLAGHVSA